VKQGAAIKSAVHLLRQPHIVVWRDRHSTFARNALCMFQTDKATFLQGDSEFEAARSHR
jgi:hypothetical protein